MKITIIGSRNLVVNDLQRFLPEETDEIVSGGAKGIDSCAREYAKSNSIKLTEFLPKYNEFGRAAPIKRKDEIIDYADMVIAFWDGKSRGTKYVIDTCRKNGKKIKIFLSVPR